MVPQLQGGFLANPASHIHNLTPCLSQCPALHHLAIAACACGLSVLAASVSPQRMVAPQAAPETTIASGDCDDRGGGRAHRASASGADSTVQKGHASSHQASQVNASPLF